MLFKNNTIIAILRGTDITSNKMSDFSDNTRLRISWSAHSPSPRLQKQQISREFTPSEEMKIAESWRSAAERSFEVCSHSLWINPVDSPVLPLPREMSLCGGFTGYETEIFPYSPIKNCIFCSAWDSCLNEFSLHCFLKEYVTKTSFQPKFGLPKMFQSFSCPNAAASKCNTDKMCNLKQHKEK